MNGSRCGFGSNRAVAIIISTFGCNNGLILAGARVSYAMAKDGLFFRSTGTLSKKGVPASGLVYQCGWVVILILLRTRHVSAAGAVTYGNLYSDLLDYVVFSVLIFYALTIAGIFVLRSKRPDLERPYRAFGYPFVPALYIVSALAIMFVLLVFALLLIPAAVVCWPQPYAQLISLPNCAAQVETKPFTPVPFTGTGISFNQDNGKFVVRVFYRLARKEDAERIVGALLSAGYQSGGVASTLDEVVTPNRNPDTTLIKTTTQARPSVDDVSRIVKIAIPVKAGAVSLFPEDSALRSGDMQVLLF